MKVTSRLLVACAAMLIALAPPSASAQPKPAKLLPAESEIAFTIHEMGVPVEGRFGKFSASIAFDPHQPATGKVSFAIDTASARFGSAELDGEVGKPEWLAAAKFPQARFDSSSIKAVGNGRFEVRGKLSIKNLSQDIVVPVQLAAAGDHSLASGSFTIHRLAFKVGEGEWTDTSMLADEVGVTFKLALSGLAPP